MARPFRYTCAERYDQAVDAYRHIIELKPAYSPAYLGATAALLTLKKLDDARGHAELAASMAREADPTLPLPIYIDARLLYDQGNYAEALPLFEQAIAELNRSGELQMTELHFYAADTLGRVERYPEAEHEFIEELKYFPQNSRARAGLAMLYQASGRPDAATKFIDEMIRDTPTPESYALAARLWTMFGNRQQADAVRAQSRRTFAESPAAGQRAARH